jgi:hypothetical protein
MSETTATFASILQEPMGYHDGGTKNLMEMSTSLSELAAMAISNIPIQDRPKMRMRVEAYQTIDQLPADLLKQLTDAAGSVKAAVMKSQSSVAVGLQHRVK